LLITYSFDDVIMNGEKSTISRMMFDIASGSAGVTTKSCPRRYGNQADEFHGYFITNQSIVTSAIQTRDGELTYRLGTQGNTAANIIQTMAEQNV